MKKTIILNLLIVAAVAGCRMDNFNKLSSTNQEAFHSMENDWNQAKLYNDSLAYCHNSGTPCQQEYIEHCDSMFHHYVDQWNHHHGNYDHNSGHCDHYHEGSDRHHHGHHNHHKNDQGHHEYHHEMMDDLMDDYAPLHP